MGKISISFHRMIYPPLKWIFKHMRKHELVYVNSMPETEANAIYAVNHSCKYDTPYICEAISKQAYVLAGKQPLRLVDRIVFYLIGTIWVDRKDKADKKRATSKMIELLKRNADLIMFPEGTWNLTPSKPMHPLYWGIIDIARTSGKPIVPAILEYTDEKCYVSFGEKMYIASDDSKSEKINELNDQFATMKWDIWERHADTGHNSMLEWENEVKKRYDEYPKLDAEYEKSVVRKEFYTAEELLSDIYYAKEQLRAR